MTDFNNDTETFKRGTDDKHFDKRRFGGRSFEKRDGERGNFNKRGGSKREFDKKPFGKPFNKNGHTPTEEHSDKVNYLFGMHPVIEALNSEKKIDKVFFKKGMEGDQFHTLLDLLMAKSIPFQFVPGDKLDKMVKGRHQGVVATIATVDYVSIEDCVKHALNSEKAPLFLILDSVTDVRNFGAIARTAECAGVNAIIIPAKGGASITPDSIKTSAGALLKMDVCKVPNLKTALYYLKESDIDIVVATEKTDNYIYSADFKRPVAIVMGAEDKGVSPAIREMATAEVKIPMQGSIGSLNVSVACGVVLYEVLRQRLP